MWAILAALSVFQQELTTPMHVFITTAVVMLLAYALGRSSGYDEGYEDGLSVLRRHRHP